jgi:hypothetical protein
VNICLQESYPFFCFYKTNRDATSSQPTITSLMPSASGLGIAFGGC